MIKISARQNFKFCDVFYILNLKYILICTFYFTYFFVIFVIFSLNYTLLNITDCFKIIIIMK